MQLMHCLVPTETILSSVGKEMWLIQNNLKESGSAGESYCTAHTTI